MTPLSPPQIQDEISKLKYKEPESTKLVILEQELVRAEAQSLVADAQLSNITRQKFKEAYDLHTAAIIERAEKQLVLAQQARRLINLLDDTPTVPGEERPAYLHADAGRDILNDAEAGLRGWTSSVEPIKSAGNLGPNAMASGPAPGATTSVPQSEHLSDQQRVEALERAQEQSATAEPPYPVDPDVPTPAKTENAALAS